MQALGEFEVESICQKMDAVTLSHFVQANKIAHKIGQPILNQAERTIYLMVQFGIEDPKWGPEYHWCGGVSVSDTLQGILDLVHSPHLSEDDIHFGRCIPEPEDARSRLVDLKQEISQRLDEDSFAIFYGEYVRTGRQSGHSCQTMIQKVTINWGASTRLWAVYDGVRSGETDGRPIKLLGLFESKSEAEKAYDSSLEFFVCECKPISLLG
jgi:hypothetical protein